MKMKPISGLFFVLLLTLWGHQILAAQTNPTLIIQACSLALQKDQCKRILESDPESKGADIHGLAKIALKQASTSATNLSKQIKQLLNKESDRKVKQSLNDCSDNYEDIIDKLKDSMAAIDTTSYNDVNTWVTAAMSNAESCEQGFKDQNVQKSPIIQMNANFHQLCSVSLAITNVLAGGI
ncbi:putative Pectinesterase inhibitor [Quillaja saponaria]|uniref:Pectinesterase inhibitor n=1 Tax=Quillaja saponaria TaxID=32244 RepID=A0AAD7Q1X3_QUISA|nr:putative Pectinesterase inhibitor [Quillaja saponaria]